MSDNQATPTTPQTLPDPFSRLSRFESFRLAVEPLAAEFWAAREPLKNALVAIERGWNCDPAGYVARYLVAGAELQNAGLSAFTTEMANAVEVTDPPTPEQVATQTAWCLIAAATADDGGRVAELLANLSTRPAIREEFAESLVAAIDTCLAKWRCENSPRFTDRLREALTRLNLTPREAMEWMEGGSVGFAAGTKPALCDWLYALEMGRQISLDDPADSWGPDVPGMPCQRWLQPAAVTKERRERMVEQLARQVEGLAGMMHARPALPSHVGVPGSGLPVAAHPTCPHEGARELKAAIPNEVSGGSGGGKKSKGKNIDARMLKVLAENREALSWTASQWAVHLDCAESTVKETQTWTERLKAVRAQQAVEHAHKMDRSGRVRRDRHKGGLNDGESDD